MNLFDMARRKDRVLALAADVAMAKSTLSDGSQWRSLRLFRSPVPQVTLSRITDWYPFCTRPETVGWYARTLRGTATLTARLTRESGTALEVCRLSLTTEPREIRFAWPMARTGVAADTALELHVEIEGDAAAELLVNKCMERDELLGLAKGVGIEVGPGPRPQVLNGPEVQVSYVEEMAPEVWKDLYDKGGAFDADKADWSNHVVGKAGALPCEDGSLDFIFSSHVFEHLANPLGHLQHWAEKLKPGGVVLAVVPDIAGTKDYAHRPSTMQEIIDEHQQGLWEPQRHHYVRWASTRAGWEHRVDEAMGEQRSIHVHFYTRENISALLDYATQVLPFEGFNIKHSLNHRDFYFVLVKR